MTIGKRIKYIRGLYHMSSAELAERTGIHPVSIRKYESDKMLPQQPQINKIAAAFSLSPAVFMGVSDPQYDFRYGGDWLGIIIMLYVSEGLIVKGDRSENGALIPETVEMSLCPSFETFFSIIHNGESLTQDDFTIKITDENTLKQFVFWEYMYNKYNDDYDRAFDDPTPENEAALEITHNDYEETEIMTLLSGRLHDIFRVDEFSGLAPASTD